MKLRMLMFVMMVSMVRNERHSFLSRHPFSFSSDRRCDRGECALRTLTSSSDPSKLLDEFNQGESDTGCYTLFLGHSGGLGSAIHLIANRILLSLARGAPMVSNATTPYATHCETQSYSCLFETFYGSTSRIPESAQCVYKASEWCFFKAAQIFRSDSPDRLAETYMSILVRHITRPSPTLKSWIETWRSEFELTNLYSRTLAVHIRRSDKEEMFHHTDQEYLERIVMLNRKFGYDRVLLGSDSNMTELIELLERDHNIHVMYIPHELFAHDPTFYQDQRNHDNSPTGLALMTQIHLMSQCAGFLGTLTSNIGRLVYELQNFSFSFFDMDGLNYFPCPMNYEPPYGSSWSTRANCTTIYESRLRQCI